MLKIPPHTQKAYNISRVAWLSLFYIQFIFYLLLLFIQDPVTYLIYFVFPSITSWGFAGILLHGIEAVKESRRFKISKCIFLFFIYFFLSFALMFFFIFMAEIILWVYQILFAFILIFTSSRIFRGGFRE